MCSQGRLQGRTKVKSLTRDRLALLSLSEADVCAGCADNGVRTCAFAGIRKILRSYAAGSRLAEKLRRLIPTGACHGCVVTQRLIGEECEDLVLPNWPANTATELIEAAVIT